VNIDPAKDFVPQTARGPICSLGLPDLKECSADAVPDACPGSVRNHFGHVAFPTSGN
jgi:hypothetical protein